MSHQLHRVASGLAVRSVQQPKNIWNPLDIQDWKGGNLGHLLSQAVLVSCHVGSEKNFL